MEVEHEYFGEVQADGKLAVEGDLSRNFRVGEKVVVRIESIPKKNRREPGAEDAATERLLDAMERAEDLGALDNPDEMRHSALLQERIEEKFS